MPELPEVETIRLQLQPRLSGRLITSAWSYPSAKFTPAAEAVGYGISRVRRRGKYLIIGLTDQQPRNPPQGDGETGCGETGCGVPRQDRAHREDCRELIIHLGMTGRLSTCTGTPPKHPHLRAWWLLGDATVLAFHDMRRFGRVHVVEAGRYDSIPTLSRLGPEPFSEHFTGDGLWQAIRASRRRIKTQLLSQRPVAGVGNIYADEALWLACINPAARRLSRARAVKLASAVREVLATGLHHNGTTLSDYVTAEGLPGGNQHNLRCYGRSGQPCSRCGAHLRRHIIDARGTTWCPSCQRR